jgi:hypothetical protein
MTMLIDTQQDVTQHDTSQHYDKGSIIQQKSTECNGIQHNYTWFNDTQHNIENNCQLIFG